MSRRPFRRAWIKGTKSSNNFGRARRLLRKAAQLMPENPEPLYLLAEAWDRDDKLSSARQAYLQVLQKDPKHQQSLYRLGLLEFDEENDDKAKEYLTRFLQTNPSGQEARRARQLLQRIE